MTKVIRRQRPKPKVAKRVNLGLPHPATSTGYAMVTSNRPIVVEHHEYLGNVVSGGEPFTAISFPMNPGVAHSFPWASELAALYSKYRIEKLELEYRPSVPDAQTTFTPIGAVIAAIQPNPTAPAPATQTDLENMAGSISVKPSQPFRFMMDCSANVASPDGLAVRTGAVPAGASANNYDQGVLYLATVGQASVVEVGRLYVTYRIRFMNPVFLGPAATALMAEYTCTGASASAPFGTSRTMLEDQIGLTFTNTDLVFPVGSAGSYRVDLTYYGSSQTVAIPTITYTGCSAGTALFASSATSAVVPAGIASTGAVFSFTVFVPNMLVEATVALSSGTLPTSSAGVINVTQINPFF